MESSTGGWCAGMLPRALAFFVLSLWVSSAWPVVADSLTIGNAKALSLGNAVTADPPGIDSIHFNPAGLARIKGRVLQLKMVAADFSVALRSSKLAGI